MTEPFSATIAAAIVVAVGVTSAVEKAYAEPAADAPPADERLFDGNETIVLELRAPLNSLMSDRHGKSAYRPAQLRHFRDSDSEQAAVTVPVEVRTRGKTRRRKDYCAFPPLRLRFGDGADGTLFAGQRSVKLVTHCHDKDSYEQYVLLEYLAYRAYNQLTERGLRARLVRMNYVHSNGRPRTTRHGILLEDWRAAAARNGLRSDDVNGAVNIDKLSSADANRVAVFQYMIGNQDWSVLWPEPDESCCHNVKPLLAPEGLVVPLPYDFDFSGIVNAPYATARGGGSNVRMRRYGGLCATQGELAAALPPFVERKEAIYALYRNQPELSARRLRSALNYLDGFYRLIDDPQQVDRRMIRRCKSE
ncbi:MAG: hypothetical protein OES38_17760 [Gammaproteobacteria bacterium]|nr:hypothetical protein [Gammaproteobacteria bacterium]